MTGWRDMAGASLFHKRSLVRGFEDLSLFLYSATNEIVRKMVTELFAVKQ